MSRWIVVLCLIVSRASFAASPPERACAFGGGAPWLHEVKVGALAHDVGKLWSHFRRERGVDYNAELVFAKFNCQLLRGRLRTNAGLSINDDGDTSKVYAGVVLEWGEEDGVFLSVGLGGAFHDGELSTREPDKKELGARVLFRVPVEFGVAVTKNHRVSVMFDHVSNGYFVDPNEGLDTLGIRYGYRF